MYDFNFNFDITHWQWPCESFNIQLITNRVIIIALRVAGQCDAMRCFFLFVSFNPRKAPTAGCRVIVQSCPTERTLLHLAHTHTPVIATTRELLASTNTNGELLLLLALGSNSTCMCNPFFFCLCLGVCPCAFFSCNCRQWPSGRHTDSALCK